MLIWRGYGIMVAIFAVLGLLASKIGAERLFGVPIPVDKKQWSELIGLCFAAALVYGLHLLLQRSSEPRAVIDKKTGTEMVLVTKHDLFFIPVRYWPFILVALGLMSFFQK